MTISSNYVVVKKAPIAKKTGDFGAVDVHDDFVYKGEVIAIPTNPIFISDTTLIIGSIVMFAKFSPDTFEFEGNEFGLDEKVKFVKTTDILALIK